MDENYAPELDGGMHDGVIEEGKDDIDLELNGSNVNGDDGEYERKIIKVANISAETTKFDESIKQLEALCKSAGGYIESSSVSGISIGYDGSANRRHASYTLRIPAEKFDEFNEGVNSMLNVTRSNSNADEVTNQYYDIESRIKVLELQKESLQEMYDNFTDYKDIDTLLYLQDQLYDVIAEIESYKTQLKLYDNKVAYSTVHLDINEVVEYTEIEEETPFHQELLEAFLGGCEVSLMLLQGLLIVLAAVTPVLLPGAIILAIAALIIFLIVRGAVKRSRRKKAQG